MSETVAVIIGTFGDMHDWLPYVRRASASVEGQTRPADAVIWEHADTLQHARNWGAAKVPHIDWFIFLDADDELDPGYIEAMLAGDGDIRRPATLGIYDNGEEDDAAVVIPERDLSTGNYIVIGAMQRSTTFFNVGGFDDMPILEDWDLWQRLVLSGAEVTAVPGAVYQIHVRDGSRNASPEHDDVYRQIRERYASGWAAR